MPSHKYVALDTRFLLSLEKGESACEEIIDFFNRFRFFCIVPETVREELTDLEFDAELSEVRRLAADTLKHLHLYNILDPELGDVEFDIAGLIAERLLASNLIEHGSRNDALVVAQSALHNCIFLITDREPLVNCDPQAIRVALITQDVTGCAILSLEWLGRIIKHLRQLTPPKGDS